MATLLRPSDGGRTTLRRSLAGSVLTGVAGQMALVISGILVTRTLSVSDRGSFALIATFPPLFVQLGLLAVPMALTYEIARPGGSLRASVASALRIGLFQAVAIALVNAAFATWLFSGRQSNLVPFALIAVVYVPGGVITQYGLAALQGLGRYRAFNLLRLMPAGAYATYVLMVFALNMASIGWLVTGWVAANLLTAAVIWRSVRREVKVERDTHKTEGRIVSTTRLLRFGARSFVGSLAPMEALGADQAVAGLLLSPSGLGLYVVGASVCNLPRFVAQSIGFVAYPHVASTEGPAQAKAIKSLIVGTAVAAGATVMALELASGLIIPWLFGPAYVPAIPVAQVLLAAAFLFGMRRVLSDAFRGAGRPLDSAVGEAVAWAALAIALTLLSWVNALSVAWSVAVAAGISLAAMSGFALTRFGGGRSAASGQRLDESFTGV